MFSVPWVSTDLAGGPQEISRQGSSGSMHSLTSCLPGIPPPRPPLTGAEETCRPRARVPFTTAACRLPAPSLQDWKFPNSSRPKSKSTESQQPQPPAIPTVPSVTAPPRWIQRLHTHPSPQWPRDGQDGSLEASLFLPFPKSTLHLCFPVCNCLHGFPPPALLFHGLYWHY